MVKHIYKKGHEHKEIEHYDVLILGGGPAGLTAALYAGRYNLTNAVIAKSFGGTANLAGEIENWPGYIGSGAELMNKFKEQAEKFGARFLEEEISNVKQDENGFVLEFKDMEIHGKSLIIALGTQHRKLNVPGEKELLGKGVSYCATCDGMFFKNKNVAVVGGANSAAKAALYLSEIAKKVFAVVSGGEFKCEPISFEKLKGKSNVELCYNCNIKEILGDKKVTGLKFLDDKGKPGKIDVDGVFIEIGLTPVVDIVHDLKLKMDKEGYIVTDKAGNTNLKGCFAAGDNTDSPFRQVVVAAGQGAIAAKAARDYLRYEYKN